jgi:hypothetical protein
MRGKPRALRPAPFVQAATKSKQKMPFHCVEHACSTTSFIKHTVPITSTLVVGTGCKR